MLTDSERAWLEQRDAIQFALDGYRVPGLDGPYEMQPDYEDAAIFEARVAAKLADLVKYSVRVCHHSCADCFLYKTNKCHDDDPGNLTCEGTILKYARLAVEEEMDAEV